MRKHFAALITSIAIFGIFGGSALADVFPGSPWTFDAFGGHYVGSCTTNFVNGKLINPCQAMLVSGTPVSSLTHISSGDSHGVITPSGVATLSNTP